MVPLCREMDQRVCLFSTASVRRISTDSSGNTMNDDEDDAGDNC